MNIEEHLMMPAEWHRHWATQMHWPSSQEFPKDALLKEVEEIYCKIIEELHFYEPIHLFVKNLETRNKVMQRLSGRAVDLDRITIHQQKIENIWCRDHGPTFVKSGSQFVIIGWVEQTRFDSSEKSQTNSDDILIPKYIAQRYNLDHIKALLPFGGGYFDVNGAGAALVSSSLISSNRKEEADLRKELEKNFHHYLGVNQVIWLQDPTGTVKSLGHIDNIARWISKDTVLVSGKEAGEISSKKWQANLDVLGAIRNENGKKLHVEVLPKPEVGYDLLNVQSHGKPTASYANFYVANGVVLVPLFDHKCDQMAMEMVAKYFPGRKVIGIDCKALVQSRGTIHGITQQWYGIG
jgi:agmatine deiminase